MFLAHVLSISSSITMPQSNTFTLPILPPNPGKRRIRRKHYQNSSMHKGNYCLDYQISKYCLWIRLHRDCRSWLCTLLIGCWSVDWRRNRLLHRYGRNEINKGGSKMLKNALSLILIILGILLILSLTDVFYIPLAFLYVGIFIVAMVLFLAIIYNRSPSSNNF